MIRKISGNCAGVWVVAEGNHPQLTAAARAVGAFPLTFRRAESAVIWILPPGGHTAHGLGTCGETGVALLEIFDATAPGVASP